MRWSSLLSNGIDHTSIVGFVCDHRFVKPPPYRCLMMSLPPHHKVAAETWSEEAKE